MKREQPASPLGVQTGVGLVPALALAGCAAMFADVYSWFAFFGASWGEAARYAALYVGAFVAIGLLFRRYLLRTERTAAVVGLLAWLMARLIDDFVRIRPMEANPNVRVISLGEILFPEGPRFFTVLFDVLSGLACAGALALPMSMLGIQYVRSWALGLPRPDTRKPKA